MNDVAENFFQKKNSLCVSTQTNEAPSHKNPTMLDDRNFPRNKTVIFPTFTFFQENILRYPRRFFPYEFTSKAGRPLDKID